MNKTILFYDGDCALCNKTVQFILNNERTNMQVILFCSLQSPYAKQVLEKYGYEFHQLSTLVLMIGDKVFYKSNAALKITRFLKLPYGWLSVFGIIPVFLRDLLYDFIAKNRKNFIKGTFCYMPSSLLKNRFIE